MLYTLGLQFTFALCLWILLDLGRARGSLGQRVPFALLAASCAIWSLGELSVQASRGSETLLFSRRLLWFGASLLPPAWMLSAAVASRAGWALRQPWRALLGAVPLLAIYSFLWWDPQGHFTSWTTPRPVHGPLFLVFWLLAWVQIAIGTSYFIEAAVRGHKASPLRVVAIVSGALLPLAGNALHMIPSPPEVDWTPVFLGFGGLLIRLSILDSGLASIVPMGRASVLEQVPTGVLIADLEGRVVDSNRAARALLAVDEAEGRMLDDLLAAAQADPARLLEVDTAPLRGPLGEVGRVALVVDRTEAARLERQLLQAQKLESLGLLAGGVAHDFNNLLTGILGNAHLARAELRPGQPARECVDEVIQASELAARLTSQMLAYSGRGRVDVRAVDASREVRSIEALLRASLAKNVQLVLALQDGLPAIEADSAQVQQVILNLVLNGAEAVGRRPGTVRVTTGSAFLTNADLGQLAPGSGARPGSHVWIEVRDDGCGMDADTKARMFDPFFSTKFTGRGLGLAAVLGVVRAHRGALRVESEEGRGTALRVYFPAAAGVAVEPEAPRAEPGLVRGSGLVLVVDDEHLVREAARRALELAGYRVLPAEGGRKAVELVRSHAGELRAVLLDLTMPDADGFETLEALRRIDPGLPVLLSSGFSGEAATRACEADPNVGFLAKPYPPEELSRRIAELAARRPLRDGAGERGKD